MKKLLISLAIASFMSSCVTVQKSMYVAASSAVDYQQYSDKNFFLSESNSVNFNYSPISSVISIVRSGYITIDKAKNDSKNQDALRDDRLNSTHGWDGKSSFRDASSEEALKELYTKALALGANGIINLKITTFTEKGTNALGSPIDLVGYSATGMAIKK